MTSESLLSELGNSKAFITDPLLSNIAHFFHCYEIEGVQQTLEGLLINNLVRRGVGFASSKPQKSYIKELLEFKVLVESLIV